MIIKTHELHQLDAEFAEAVARESYIRKTLFTPKIYTDQFLRQGESQLLATFPTQPRQGLRTLSEFGGGV